MNQLAEESSVVLTEWKDEARDHESIYLHLHIQIIKSQWISKDEKWGRERENGGREIKDGVGECRFLSECCSSIRVSFYRDQENIR
jgi:hypothetical protein